MPELRFIATNGRSTASKLIRFWTRSGNRSHIAVLLDDGRWIEQWNHDNRKGVFALTKSYAAYSGPENHTPGTEYEIWSLSCTQEEKDFCLQYWYDACARKEPYDHKAIYGHFWKFSKERKGKSICCGLAIAPVKLQRLLTELRPDHTNPQTFIELIQAMGAEFERGEVV